MVRFGLVQSWLLFDNQSVPLSPWPPGRKRLITGCCCMSRLGQRCSGCVDVLLQEVAVFGTRHLLQSHDHVLQCRGFPHGCATWEPENKVVEAPSLRRNGVFLWHLGQHTAWYGVWSWCCRQSLSLVAASINYFRHRESLRGFVPFGSFVQRPFFVQLHRIAHRKSCNPFSDTTKASVWIFNPVLLTVHWARARQVTSDAANMQLMDCELFMVNVAENITKQWLGKVLKKDRVPQLVGWSLQLFQSFCLHYCYIFDKKTGL